MALLSGRYQLRDVVYDDGVVTVHRGHDQLLNRPVTIELLRPEAPIGAAEALRDKSRRTALGELPNVAALYDQGEHEGRTYLVFEELLGVSLADAAPLAPPDAARLLSGLAATLSAARSRRSGAPRLDGQSVRWDGDRAQIVDWGTASANPLPDNDGALLGSLLALALTGSSAGTGSSSLPRPLRGVVDRALRGEFASGHDLQQALGTALRRADDPTQVVARGRPTIMLSGDDVAPAAPVPPPTPPSTTARPARATRVPASGYGDREVAIPRRRSLPWLLAGLLLLVAAGAGAALLRNPARAETDAARTAVAARTTPASNTAMSAGEPYVVATVGGTRLNVRDGPGANYPEVGKLTNGTVVRVVEGPVTGGQFRWARIEGPGVSGWCVFDALRPQ
ncbi:MAG TPA: SH3 domain-containing protein [Herpetosiphonaceae bacterium]|nr:SH3 domain-containing protein [Herpetosiphonaceae bacterium]